MDREPLPTRVDDLPDLADEARALLRDCLPALGLGDLSPAVLASLEDHLRLLSAWNQAINLTAIREDVAAVRLHLLDSLTAIALLRQRRIDAFIDLGSGAGFPGLPVALVLPARRALLVESIGKKARFLETAARSLGIEDRVEAFAGRAETLAADDRHRERWPAVLVRAVGSLPELVEVGLPLVAPGGVLVAWKRNPVAPELEAAAGSLAALGGGRPTTIPVDLPGIEEHVLVVVEKIGRTPIGYPRDPAVRKRQPW